jgi:hypothetical protein
MPELTDTRVLRGGVTARWLEFETKKCSFEVDKSDKSLDFHFTLASKGGGTTEVLLRVGQGDLPMILDTIAHEIPKAAAILATSAAAASAMNMALLEEAEKGARDLKAMAKDLRERLEIVDDFVTAQYHLAPAGDDESEAAAYKELQEVLNSLHGMAT